MLRDKLDISKTIKLTFDLNNNPIKKILAFREYKLHYTLFKDVIKALAPYNAKRLK